MSSNEEDPEAAFLMAMRAQQEAEDAELREEVPTTIEEEEEHAAGEVVTTPSVPKAVPSSIDEVVVPSGVDSSESAIIASLLSPSRVSQSPSTTPTVLEPSTTIQSSSISAPEMMSSESSSSLGVTNAVDNGGATNDPPSTDFTAGPFVFDAEEDAEGEYVAGGSDAAAATPASANENGGVLSPHPINVVPSASSLVSSDQTNLPPTLLSDIRTLPPDTDAVNQSASTSKLTAGAQNKRKRLPQDIVGQLEDRIAEDPRGDVDAWLSLINEHQKKGKLDETRSVYERYLVVFPAAAEQWVAYCQLELSANEFYRVEQLFSRCLLNVFNVDLWSLYLDYIRRRNNLVTDVGGKARSTVSQSYEFVLNNIGIDRDSGRIWQDYVAFIKSGQGVVGGSNWQDQQKMDHLRKVYQRVICIPVNGVESMWKEYDSFEMGLNKITGRKYLQEKSPMHMTARSSLSELKNITSGIVRTALPRLPPAPGCDGYDEFNQQIDIWKRWIMWEKSDPLVLATEDLVAYQARILYVYRQSLMALRFWPEIWYDAFEYCIQIGKEKEAVDFLKQGMKANPESCLLHFRYAEYLESSVPAPPTEDKEATKRRSGPIRQIYDDILDVYYNMTNKIQQRENDSIARIEEQNSTGVQKLISEDDDDEDFEPAPPNNSEAHITALKEATRAEMLILSKTISAIWINLMRAMRRVEGHGRVGELIGGSRQIFADARKRGKVTSDVYVASALIEYHCYKDPAASRIFDRGMKVFPDDEEFALEYLKHLTSINDLTNARAVFETFVGKIPAEKADQAKRIYHFFYNYESQYGELSQVSKLEKRMKELYPQDPHLRMFTNRYAYKMIDPSTFIPVISPTQTRPRQAPGMGERNITIQQERSPKRAAENDSDYNRQQNERPNKKIHRGESPLKGAAGRRLDQQKRAAATRGEVRDQRDRDRGDPYQPPPANSNQLQQPAYAGPAPIPDAVMFLLSILPPSHAYNATRFKPDELLKLLISVQVPNNIAEIPKAPPVATAYPYQR